ncbi:MAG: hypothetical protein ACLR0U_09290 [Enterocloster clostridioformis]
MREGYSNPPMVTVDGPDRIYEDGGILYEDGVITHVGDGGNIIPRCVFMSRPCQRRCYFCRNSHEAAGTSWEPVNRAYGKRGYVSLKKVKGRPMFFLSVICLIFIKHQPFLYLMAILPGFSACIGTVSAPVITSGIFVTKHYAEIYGFLSLFPAWDMPWAVL